MLSLRSVVPALAMLLIGFVSLPSASFAHCDTMNGPVVKAARLALEKKDVRPALMWVAPEAEAEIRAAFNTTLTVRALSPEAKALADRYFFETLVRVHRAGEGAPYTGLKEDDSQRETGIELAEHALQEGSAASLTGSLSAAMAANVKEAFHKVHGAMNYAPTDVEAGRRYVAAYIAYIHYVERLHQVIGSMEGSAEAPAEGHVH